MINEFIARLLQQGIISKSKRRSFVSYPFLLHKGDQRFRFLVDFGHLRNSYVKPFMELSPLLDHARHASFPKKINQQNFFAKIDLKNAFYAIPIPLKWKAVSTFAFGEHRFAFNRLPMGLFGSPTILQAVVEATLRDLKRKCRVHLDDILIWDTTSEGFKESIRRALRLLNGVGFLINFETSCIVPTKIITYCGMTIFEHQDTVFFNLTEDKLSKLKKILLGSKLTGRLLELRAKAAWARSWLGYICYCFTITGISSAWRFLLNDLSWRKGLWGCASSGPWPWPRPPIRHWAADATPTTIAGVDEKGLRVFSTLAHLESRTFCHL